MFNLTGYEQCLKALGSYATLNFVTIKRKETTELDFLVKKQDPNMYNYNVKTIPGEDSNINSMSIFL